MHERCCQVILTFLSRNVLHNKQAAIEWQLLEVHNLFMETYIMRHLCDRQIWTWQLLLIFFPLFALFILLCLFFLSLNQSILKFCHSMILSPLESSLKNQELKA